MLGPDESHQHSHGRPLHSPADLHALGLSFFGQDQGHIAINDFHWEARFHGRFLGRQEEEQEFSSLSYRVPAWEPRGSLGIVLAE